MHIEPSLRKPVICIYFKKIVGYTLLSFCSLMLIPSYALAAKTKKAAVATDQKQQERILTYTALYLENPGKLAKYMAVYHKESNCIVLDINKIDLSNEATIMHTIYCGQQLNSLLQHKEKAAWSLAQRYYTAYSLARLDLNSYQNYRKGLGKHDCTFEGLLAGAIVDAIQMARFRDQDAIFARMVPYMMRLFPIKEQVRLSKVQVMTLATAEPVLHEPAGL